MWPEAVRVIFNRIQEVLHTCTFIMHWVRNMQSIIRSGLRNITHLGEKVLNCKNLLNTVGPESSGVSI